MSRKLVLLAFISFFILTALVSQTTSSQSLSNKQYFIPKSETILDSKISGSRTLAETVHNLDTGLNYTTIQEAIDANETLDGHTIFVEEGIYYENVVINKSLSLIGEDRSTTIIDGNHTGRVVEVTADDARISNFTIQNSRLDHYWDSGIFVGHSKGSNVSYNIVKDNFLGIVLAATNDTNVCGNTVFENKEYGILLDGAHNCTLLNNNMTDNNYNFGVQGSYEWDYDHSVDMTNTVNGKYVYYLKYVSNAFYDAQTNASTFILFKCSNITLKGLTLAKNRWGVFLWNSTDCRIENVFAVNNTNGIRLWYSNHTVVSDSVFSSNPHCNINIISSHRNLISRNTASTGNIGIHLMAGSHRDPIGSSNNVILDNNISINNVGVRFLRNSSENIFLKNNFIQNENQTVDYTQDSMNVWDDDFEGNYWSDYNGTDSDYDGIGDDWYEIDENNTDHHPLMGMFSDFNVTLENHVQTICNSTICDPRFNGTAITFNVSGEAGTLGFCRICIPTALMNEMYRVFVNGKEMLPVPLPLQCSNTTHNYLYFNYTHSKREVVIIPEFPSFLILPLFMITTLLAVIVYKRKHAI